MAFHRRNNSFINILLKYYFGMKLRGISPHGSRIQNPSVFAYLTQLFNIRGVGDSQYCVEVPLILFADQVQSEEVPSIALLTI